MIYIYIHTYATPLSKTDMFMRVAQALYIVKWPWCVVDGLLSAAV